jgi:hypothetical protein
MTEVFHEVMARTLRPVWSSPVQPAPLAASYPVSLSPYVNEQLPNWEELLSAHDVARLTRRPRWVLASLVLLRRFPKRRHPRHGAIVETAKTVIVEWSPELREVIERACKLGPDIRKTLICNLQGKPFTESGFRSNWHRLIQSGLTRGASAVTAFWTFSRSSRNRSRSMIFGPSPGAMPRTCRRRTTGSRTMTCVRRKSCIDVSRGGPERDGRLERKGWGQSVRGAKFAVAACYPKVSARSSPPCLEWA